MTPGVPFLDVGAAYRELRAETDEAIARVLGHGWFILGDEVAAFEREFAAYVGARHCVGVANGLDALRLSLQAMGVRSGDEVIVPSMTFIATWLAVTQLGAVPVPVEPDEATFNIHPDGVRAAITERTRVIMPVHLYGQPADMDALLALGRERGIAVLEDAAQAHGARYRGRPVGSLGRAAAWSFYPAKNLGALGDGGAVTTNDDGLAAELRLLRNYGSAQKYVSEREGWNSRLDELQAAVLRVRLRRLDEWNALRARAAERYAELLSDVGVELPRVPEWASPCWHLYVVRSRQRDALQEGLLRRGIGTGIHYPIPPHAQRAYARLGFAADAFPVASAMCRQVLSLPMGPHLDEQQQLRVAEAVASCARDRLLAR